MALADLKCVPCHSDTPPLTHEEAAELARETPQWTLKDDSIERAFKFKDFKQSMAFVNRVAAVADEEDHHPDIDIRYNRVKLVLTTHNIGGLSRNDFIMAGKIDRVADAG